VALAYYIDYKLALPILTVKTISKVRSENPNFQIEKPAPKPSK
jgi:hypothetical protein